MNDAKGILTAGPNSEQSTDDQPGGTVWRNLYYQLDILFTLLLIAAQFNYRLIFSAAPIGGLNMVDGSWIVDLPFKLERGVLLGRDVIFSFGPLFQVETAAIPKIVGLDIGLITKSFWVAPVLLAAILLLICTRFIFSREYVWQRIFVLVVTEAFSFADLRQIIPIAIMVSVFQILHATVTLERRRGVIASAVGAILLAFAFLYSADTIFYSLAALVIGLGAYFLCHYKDRIARAALLRSIIYISIAVIGVTVAITAWLGLQYWRAAYEMVSNYRWALALGMAQSDEDRLFVCMGVSVVLGAVGWYAFKHTRTTMAVDRAFILGIHILSLLAIQSAIVRSSAGHARYAICGLIFASSTSAAIALSIGGRHRVGLLRRATLIIPIPLMAALLLPFGVSPLLAPAQVLSNLTAPVSDRCPPAMPELQHICVTSEQYQEIGAATNFLKQYAASQQSIVVFPYENMFGIAASRSVAGGVIQNYSAVGDYLVTKQIEGLERADAPAGIYTANAAALDAVPSFTRSPEVWFYLQSHYSTAQTLVPGVLGIRRDEQRSRLVRQATLVTSTTERVLPVQHRDARVEIGQIAWTPAADFLAIEMTIAYPVRWKLTKPSSLTADLQLSNGAHKFIPFIARPNRRGTIWLFPWDEVQLGKLFDADPSQWHPSEQRPSVTSVAIEVHPFDRLSARPRKITVHTVRVVSLTAALLSARNQ